MRLRQLKISGFKSFADTTVIEFPGAVSGIVGPNGCGKSNVIDAIRWVLGEGRVSELRGKGSMSELIFAGSQGRPASSRASVEMVLDNNDGSVKGAWGRYGEIAVRRVVTRDGTNAYFINGQQVRRRDVQDIFMGTGLGPRSYAIISQGMISNFIKAKPEELRVYLEEAAGVSKYKERRRETETSLNSTRANLEKVAMLQANKAEEVERLTAEAETAQSWKKLDDERARSEEMWYFLQERDAKNSTDKLSAQIAEKENALISAKGEAAKLVAEEAGLREDARKKRDAADKAREAAWQANARVTEAEGNVRHIIEQRRTLEERISQTQAALERRKDAKKEAAERIAMLSAKIEELNAQAEEAAAEAEALTDEVEERAAQCEEARSRYEDTRADAQKAEKSISVVSVEIESMQREAIELDRQKEKLEGERQTSDAPDEAAVAELGEKLSEKRAALDEQKAVMEDVRASLEESEAVLEETREEKTRMQGEVSRSEARLQTLEAVQAKAQAEGKLPEWLEKMGLSSVKRFFERTMVNAQWAKAVEAVLSVRSLAIGVSDLARVAGFALDAPPARLVFYNTLFTEKAEAVTPPAGIDSKPLTDFVTSDDPAVAALLTLWLGTSLTAPDLAAALKVRTDLPPGARFVTPEGHIVERDSVSFWAEENAAAGLMSRIAEIKHLTEALAQLKAQFEAADAAMTRAKAALDADRRDLDERQQSAERLESEVHALELDYSRESEKLAAWKNRRGQIEETLKELTARAEELARRQEEAEGRFETLDAKLSELQQKAGDAQTHLEEAEEAQAMTQERQRAVQAKAKSAQIEAQATKDRQTDAERQLQDADGEIEMTAAEIEELRAQFEGLDETAEREGLAAVIEELERFKAAEAEALAASDAAEAKLAEASERSRALTAEQGPLLEVIGDLKTKRQAGLTQTEIFTARLNELGSDREKLTVEAETEHYKASQMKARVTKLAESMAALGPVNHAALENLEQSKKAMEETARQVEDLEKAIRNLEATIREIDTETRGLLKSTFEAVNANFAEMFTALFSGGTARLEMTGDEILECGVEVMAQPPGKKNKTIMLLSGGEQAMTATALVFAIFRLNPAPFCLLDEVDAPLDEANQDRLARQIVAMSSSTQFMMITHHRVTMEYMGQLVGVTMREPGVSRVVSVDIAEADRMAQH